MKTIASTSVSGGNGLTSSTTTNPSTGNYRLAGAFLTDRLVTVDYIEVLLDDMVNPLGMGTYPVTMAIQSTTGCTYLSGSANLVIDKIPSMTSVALSVSNTNRNLYETYNFAVTPATSSLSSGDYLMLTLPSTPQQVLLSQLGVVVSILSNSNLISLTSQVAGTSKIRLDFSISSTGYASNKTLAFALKYLRNPDFVGDVSGFVFQLYTSSNMQYENFTNLIQTYTNYISTTSATAVYSNSYVGLSDSVTLELQLDTQLVLGTKIYITASEKFQFLPASTQLLTSSIPATLQVSSGSTNQLSFTLTSDVAPGTKMSFVLRARNPIQPTVVSSDFVTNVTTPDGKQVSAPVFFSRQVFSCDIYCADCFGLFSNCTSCVNGYYLNSAKCLLQTEVNQVIPPFIFAGIGVALLLLLATLGGGCDVRNYWCNMLYPLFKLDMFAFLVYFGYSWSINLLNISWFKYVGYAIVAAHFILGWWFLALIKSDAKISGASFENVEPNGHRYPLTKAEEELGSSDEALEQEFNGSVKFSYILGFIFSAAMPRWLFSARGKTKGYYWFLAENDFSQLKHHFNIYQFLYFLFVLIPTTAMSTYQLYQTWGANGWKNYLVEMGLMTILDAIYFIMAFCELLSPPKKAGKKIFSKSDKYASAKDINAAESSVVLQGGPLLDNTLRDDESPSKLSKQLFPARTSIIVGAATSKPSNLEISRPAVFEIRNETRRSQVSSSPQKLDYVRLQHLAEYNPKTSALASPNNRNLRESQLNSLVFSPAGNKTPTNFNSSQVKVPQTAKLNVAGTSMIVIAGKTPKRSSNYSSLNKDIFVPLPEQDYPLAGTEAQSLIHSGTNLSPKKKPTLGVRVEDLRPKQVDVPVLKLAPHPISGIMRPEPVQYGVFSEKEELKILPKRAHLRSQYGNLTSEDSDFQDDGQLTHRRGMELSVEDNEEVFTYFSSQEDITTLKNIKIPKKSRFVENQLFSKWGFARTDPKKYYEIIYEEDSKEKVSLRENPLYDPYPKRTEVRPKSPGSLNSPSRGEIVDSATVAVERKPPKIIVKPQPLAARVPAPELESLIETTSPRVWQPLPIAPPPTNKIINGQLESDLQRGILRDRNKKVLDLNNQPISNPFESGKFVTEDPELEISLPSQPPRQFSKGIMKDAEGRVFRIADQDFELLSKGITLGRDGQPDNFNGQKPEEVKRGLIRDRDGECLNLNKVTPDDYRKGTFITDASRKVDIGAEQDPEKVKVGLLTAPDGNDYRMKDQKFEEIQKAGVFRDRNLIPLLLKKLPDTIYEEESDLEDDFEPPAKPPTEVHQIKVTESAFMRNSDLTQKRPESIPRIAIDTAVKQKPVPGPAYMEKKEEGAYYKSPRNMDKLNPSNDDGTSGREDTKKPPKVILKKNPTGPKPAFIKSEETKMSNKNVELDGPHSRSIHDSSRNQDPNVETNRHSRPESGKHSVSNDKLDSKPTLRNANQSDGKRDDLRDQSPRVEILTPNKPARVEEPTLRPVKLQESAIKTSAEPLKSESRPTFSSIKTEPPASATQKLDRYQRLAPQTKDSPKDYVLDEHHNPQLKTASRLEEEPPIEDDDGKRDSHKDLDARKPSGRPPIGVSYAKAENPGQVESKGASKDQTPRDSQRPLKRLSLKKRDSLNDTSKPEAGQTAYPTIRSKNLEIDEIRSHKSKVNVAPAKKDEPFHQDPHADEDLYNTAENQSPNKNDESDELPVRQSPRSTAKPAQADSENNVRPIGAGGQLQGIKNYESAPAQQREPPTVQEVQGADNRPKHIGRDNNLNKLMGHRDDSFKMESLADLIEGDVESKFYTRRGTIEGTDPNEPNFGKTGNYSEKYPDLPSRGFRDAYDPDKELSSIKMEGDDDRGSHLGRNSPLQRRSGSNQPGEGVPKSDNQRNKPPGAEFNRSPQDKRPMSSAGNQPPKPRPREMSVDQNLEKTSNVVQEPRQNQIKAIKNSDPQTQNGANPADSKISDPPSVQVSNAKQPGSVQPVQKSAMPQDLSKTASQLPPKNVKPQIPEPQSARIPTNQKDNKSRGERSIDPNTNLADSPKSGSLRRKDSRASEPEEKARNNKKASGNSELPILHHSLPRNAGEDSIDSPDARREKMPPLPKLAQSSGSHPHAKPSENHRLPAGPQRGNGLPPSKPSDRDIPPKSGSNRNHDQPELPMLSNPQSSNRKPGTGSDRSNPNDIVAESLPNNANPNLRRALRPFGVPGQPLPDSDTMYLDLVMDESLDIELNIEEMEDEEEDPDNGERRQNQPQYEIIGKIVTHF